MRTPSDLARRGVYSVVAPIAGDWKLIATPTDRAGAIERMRATPGARAYGPNRRQLAPTEQELSNPVFAQTPPTPANLTAAQTPPPKRPRLTDSINVRVTTEMRQQIERRAADGARWPGGYAVENADVVRDALRKYFQED